MAKYIIRLERGETAYKTVNSNGKPMIQLLAPTLYTEPDLEQVRKEAYEKGYETAKHEREDCLKQVYTDAIRMEGYQKGLSDAWETARKVTQVRKYGGYGDCLEEVFGRHRVPWDVFDYSASEAIEKIRQYEQKKDRQARIEYNFDEIKDVLETTVKECNVSLDEIAEVLRKMGETNNG